MAKLDRTRRRAVAATLAVVAVAAVALLRPGPWFRSAAPDPGATAAPVEFRPTPAADWGSSPLALPGDWVVTSAVRRGSGWVLDRGRNRYLPAEGHRGVWPAPQGGAVAVIDDDTHPRQIGLADANHQRITWTRVGWATGQPQWSPDGRRLALTTSDKETGTFSFGVLGTDGRFRRFPVDTKRYFCTDYCSFTWTRDGREVALQQTDAFAPRSETARHPRWGVQLFSADDGRPTRLVRMPGDPAGPWAWSPDGKLVVVQGQQEALLVETADGRVVRPLPTADVAFVSNDRLLYRRPHGREDFVLTDLAARELVRQPVPSELVDREISVAPR
ncbi:TolB family protein [Micromonospora sp. DT233]|uniref:TolB family protein n=1 Tax=Micromonospora sp. DT233 TaxID=3393432 RepID=UPI003CEA9DAD